jgi:hypothetical protein
MGTARAGQAARQRPGNTTGRGSPNPFARCRSVRPCRCRASPTRRPRRPPPRPRCPSSAGQSTGSRPGLKPVASTTEIFRNMPRSGWCRRAAHPFASARPRRCWDGTDPAHVIDFDESSRRVDGNSTMGVRECLQPRLVHAVQRRSTGSGRPGATTWSCSRVRGRRADMPQTVREPPAEPHAAAERGSVSLRSAYAPPAW